MKHYVMGFAFTPNMQRVLLIKKKRPDWQAGKWNGIGGHIEPGESPKDAMMREFTEECGLRIPNRHWTHTLTIVSDVSTLFVFKTTCDLRGAYIAEDQEVNDFSVWKLPDNAIDNLLWMVPMQLGVIGWPVFMYERQPFFWHHGKFPAYHKECKP